jgi:hypothetical protein
MPLPLGGPAITRLGSPDAYIEFAVHVRGIGHGALGTEPDLDPRSWTRQEITQSAMRAMTCSPSDIVPLARPGMYGRQRRANGLDQRRDLSF